VHEMTTEKQVKAFLQGSTAAESLEQGHLEADSEQGVLEDIRQKLREIDELLEQIG